MASVKWIKITTDMFDNRKIKHLRKLPEGNSIVLIWVMLLTMAGRCNAGGMIFLTENIPYTTKMLADELDFEESTVQLALKALEQFNMVVMENGFYTIAGWDEYQNIDGLEKIKEQNRLRKQRQREKQKMLMSRDSHGTVTPGHATESESESDLEGEREDRSIDLSIRDEKTGSIDRLINNSTFSDIKEQIDYDGLTRYHDADLVDIVVSCIADMYTATEPQRFNGRLYSAELIQERSMELNNMHIEYVLDCFENQKEKVHNVRNYIKTSLFNAPDTMGAYYTNKVRADGAVY